MPALPSDLRPTLESKIIAARRVAEAGAQASLVTLAVEQSEPFAGMNEEQRQLRRALRAKARQLGEGSLTDGIPLLIEEMAYQQWHRMLFARFLAENHLLMHPEGVAVTLADCAELAPEEGAADAWELAARYAGRMLPGIFRLDDPAAQVRFAPESRHQLEQIIGELPPLVFTADDSLGWAYQFWQTEKKAEVNASERKIGGADLAPVTQLFTEHYMVQFLLENSLGAWWAARHPKSPLIKDFEYLRFREDGTPAAGTFPGWPERAAEVTVMDPCCGSGHFLVAAFEMLRRMRREEEGLAEAEAAEAVLQDNLFGLELDPRCTQIAAFALIFAAWKTGGYREVPLPNVACSGIAVAGQLETWTKLADEDYGLKTTLERLYHLFRNAPDLGSLINPGDIPLQDRMFISDYAQIEPLLEQVLYKEETLSDPTAAIFGAAAVGVAGAARLLARTYTLVITNVPYLKRSKQAEILRNYCETHHKDSKADLATVFINRCSSFTNPEGSYALVTPQNWSFLGSYKKLRTTLLKKQTWDFVARLGPGAFETISGEVVNVALSIFTNEFPSALHTIASIDATPGQNATEKAQLLRNEPINFVSQVVQLENPDARITLKDVPQGDLLERYASCFAGILNGDSPRFQRFFWELINRKDLWSFQQSTVVESQFYGGREKLILFDESGGHLREEAIIRREKLHDSDRRGNQAWGKMGIGVSQMGEFPVTLYTGEKFDSNVAVILPNDQALVPAIWAFCTSADFRKSVRRIDQKLNVTNATFVKVPFDLEYWQKVAEEAGPLPEPYSNDPTQWLFEGNPIGSIEPLQVAVARMLGYQWPQQQADDLEAFVDADGIVCLPAVAGDPSAAERLRALLAAAYGDEWSQTVQDRLLDAVDFGNKGLGQWLLEGFFAQHCKLFKNRPFIWHIWDGRRDGFSALVNYHKLDAANLDRLIYTYLGSWITTQRAARDAGEAGADGRLVTALELQKKLEAIRDGEPPYDIYVRWKPLHEQPLGWNPDLNDGVRLNIRPFVTAGVLRRKFTVHWKKDRGRNYDESERLNDLHFTRVEKLVAREQAGV
jgi:hypothetical protein